MKLEAIDDGYRIVWAKNVRGAAKRWISLCFSDMIWKKGMRQNGMIGGWNGWACSASSRKTKQNRLTSRKSGIKCGIYGRKAARILPMPAKLRENLQNAYNAYRKLTNEESGEQTETMLSQYDDVFYRDEEEINCVLRAYASKIGS